MFVCQQIFKELKLKKVKGAEYIICWKSKGAYNYKFIALYGACLPYEKYFGNKIGIQFNSTFLVKQQNNYATKIVNVYIVYDLDNWPKNPLRNFTLKNCLLGLTNIVKDNAKEKSMYSGYEIAFDGKGKWSFGNDFARNVIIFAVNNSSWSHTNNLKNDFVILILAEGGTFGINGSFDAPEKKNWYDI